MMKQFIKQIRASAGVFCRLALIFCLTASHTLPAFAEPKALTYIRDAEIEHYLRQLSTPIFHAASIDPSHVNLLLVKNTSINAFVAGGMNIFFYTGLLEKTESPEELQAVIAHETGHIAGGHLLRGHEAMEGASAQAIIGMLAGLLAALASGKAEAAAAGIGAAQSMAERTFLRFSRTQESSADAAAIRFLGEAGQSVEGLLGFMKKLQGQELLPTSHKDEYVRTHPLTTNRIKNIEYALEHKDPHKGKKLGAKFNKQHERMKAKLLGYLHPQTALLRYTDKDPRMNARYARAIALYRTNKTDRALALMNGLLKEEPDNPFFREQKAQILFENGKVAAASTLYREASAARPNSALLHQAYAHTLLELGDKDSLHLAVNELTKANRLEQRSPRTWRFLAAAWGRLAEINKNKQYQGLSIYALAEEAVTLGKHKEAKTLADKAIKSLKKGTPYWIRAQDIKLTARND